MDEDEWISLINEGGDVVFDYWKEIVEFDFLFGWMKIEFFWVSMKIVCGFLGKYFFVSWLIEGKGVVSGYFERCLVVLMVGHGFLGKNEYGYDKVFSIFWLGVFLG